MSLLVSLLVSLFSNLNLSFAQAELAELAELPDQCRRKLGKLRQPSTVAAAEGAEAWRDAFLLKHQFS